MVVYFNNKTMETLYNVLRFQVFTKANLNSKTQ